MLYGENQLTSYWGRVAPEFLQYYKNSYYEISIYVWDLAATVTDCTWATNYALYTYEVYRK